MFHQVAVAIYLPWAPALVLAYVGALHCAGPLLFGWTDIASVHEVCRKRLDNLLGIPICCMEPPRLLRSTVTWPRTSIVRVHILASAVSCIPLIAIYSSPVCIRFLFRTYTLIQANDGFLILFPFLTMPSFMFGNVPNALLANLLFLCCFFRFPSVVRSVSFV